MVKKFTTYDEIENLCEALTKDFLKSKHYTNVLCVDIEAFVTEYLRLPIVYESFAEPDPGRIGFLSTGNDGLWVREGTKKILKKFPAGTVVLDSFLKNAKELARWRFTLAHEGAHFFMAKHIPAQTRPAYHSEYDSEMKYDDELLRSLLSVNEMYINRAAACCLMPQFLIHRVLKRYNDGRKIVCFDSYILAQE